MIKIFILLLSMFTLAKEKKLEVATFAGGCFWCVEADLEKLNGVVKVVSGYSDGNKLNPTYSEVSSGKTAYIESVQVSFDPDKISYEKLVQSFLKTIDPTDTKGQFVDKGYQYLPAIFFHDNEQEAVALKSRDKIIRANIFKKPVSFLIKKIKNFYAAEDYHQDFYKKNKKSRKRYKSYRKYSGRDRFIEKYWSQFKFNKKYKKPSDEELKKKLSNLSYKVTQKEGTEAPFKNKYWNHKKEGIYVDVVSGEPLFSSKDKFKSGTGWPSFTRPITKDALKEFSDSKFGMKRVEVKSKFALSHLGHVFSDGPKPSGLRYCINSASLEFIAKKDLEKRGYSYFLRNNF